ncbi:MAG: hypothetical protein Q9199_004409 [Rusavskia elegans]
MATPNDRLSPANTQHAPKSRRRQRVINSCFECRRRKLRCSKTYPCYNCSRFSRNCLFVAFQHPQAPAAARAEAKSDGSASYPSRISDDDDARLYFPNAGAPSGPSDGGGPPPEPISEVMLDAMFDADAEDDLMDLGLQIGRLCITERLGGIFRPGLSSELDALLAKGGGRVPDQTDSGQSENTTALIQNIQPSAMMEPSLDLLLPATQLSTKVDIYYFITQPELDMLYHQYFRAVHPLAHVLHKPTFDRQFYRSCLSQDPSSTPTRSFTALVLALCFAAAVSLSMSQPQVQFQTTKTALVDRLKLASEQALVAAQHMKSLKLETLQAFAIYLIPQVCGQISRAQTSLVGALVRLAQCAGLHRDASQSYTSPLECHIRSLLWYQICFLDLHTCEAQGPQPMIHDDDFDTPLPMNVDDLAFEVSTLPIPSNGFTDVTLSLMRFEITELHKSIFRDRIALMKKTTDLSTVRAAVESRMQAIAQKYLDNLDDSIPIQRCARLTGTSLLSRCIPMVVQVFLKFDDRSDAQQEILDTMITRSLDMMEASATLETATDLSTWAWYAPTYQQYHSILPPLVLLYLEPDTPHAARASAMIDHVFGKCYGISRQQRCGDLLRMLLNECGAFLKLRKVKHVAVRSSKSTETSPPNIEAAFEDFRQSQPTSYAQPLATGLGGGLDVTKQSLQDLGGTYAEASLTNDQWWSLPMPDEADFIDPLFNFPAPT